MPQFTLWSFLNQAFAGVTTLVAMAPAYYVLRLMTDPDDTIASTSVVSRRIFNGVKKTAVNLGLRRKVTCFDGVLKHQPYGRPVEYERTGHLFYERGFWADVSSNIAARFGFITTQQVLDRKLLRLYVKQHRADDIPRPWPFLNTSDHVAALEFLLKRELTAEDVAEIAMVKRYRRWARIANLLFPFSLLAGFI
jgi:hypothetical protein